MNTHDNWVSGESLRHILEEQSRLHSEGAIHQLSKLDRGHTWTGLHQLIRSVEDLINIDEVASHNVALDRAMNVALDRLQSKDAQESFGEALQRRFDEAACRRVIGLFSHVSVLREFILSYQGDFDGRFSGLRTPRDLANYLKSRRRHLNTLLYAVSDVCTGNAKLSAAELFRLAFRITDYTLVTLTGLHQKLAKIDLYSGYGCWHTGNGLLDGSLHWQEFLDDNYLEAERIAITDLPSQELDRSLFDVRKIISAAELRGMLSQIENSYQEFDLREKGFSDLTFFIEELLSYTKDDYFVRVPVDAYRSISARYVHTWWLQRAVYRADPAHPFLGSFAPFVEIGGSFESNLFLLMRFAYNTRDRILEKHRRYQIRSGFLFEDLIKNDLVHLGFTVLGIKRIQRKEFDVVTTRNGIIHNFQCKNVRLDYQQMESDIKTFIRHNKRIVRYFERALRKEEAREALLIAKIGLREIRHYVISRFPVFSENKRIIALRDLKRVLGGV
ncbi:hypothetical protein [Rhodanobacter glycinis]|nr:hypothetical protein [Rhodanobacter glycinis]